MSFWTSLWSWCKCALENLHEFVTGLEGRGIEDRFPEEPLQLARLCQTCQCPCRTAQKSGGTPRLLVLVTAAPRSSSNSQTSSFPLPAAAVRAEESTFINIVSLLVYHIFWHMHIMSVLLKPHFFSTQPLHKIFITIFRLKWVSQNQAKSISHRHSLVNKKMILKDKDCIMCIAGRLKGIFMKIFDKPASLRQF